MMNKELEMLANKDTVRAFVQAMTDLRGSIYSKRTWLDKSKKDPALRNMAFRFYDAVEADRVAGELQDVLTRWGYTNRVRRTTSAYCAYARCGGYEYVRVQVLF
jgi:hypothetical protein